MKSKVLRLLKRTVKEKIQTIEASIESAKTAALEAPGFMQSASDTTKSEMGQLIEGLIKEKAKYKKLLFEIDEQENKFYDSNLFKLIGNDEKKYFFIIKNGGAINITLADKNVTSISPDTPLAKKIMTKDVGGEIEISGHKYKIELVE